METSNRHKMTKLAFHYFEHRDFSQSSRNILTRGRVNQHPRPGISRSTMFGSLPRAVFTLGRARSNLRQRFLWRSMVAKAGSSRGIFNSRVRLPGDTPNDQGKLLDYVLHNVRKNSRACGLLIGLAGGIGSILTLCASDPEMGRMVSSFLTLVAAVAVAVAVVAAVHPTGAERRSWVS